MKILITGTNGFIGSYIARFLLEKGYEVIATSRKFHPSVQSLLQKAELIELDVLDTEWLQKNNITSDVIIHTATANDIISKKGAQGLELSGMGTKNILDFAVRNNIRRCIIFSTLQVYGTELYGEISEKSPLHFENDYGINHLVAEMYAEMYTRQGKLHCVSVRPSNVYGPVLSDAFNRWSLVPGCFCLEAADKGSITIRSSGRQMRNFVHLENLSRALETIIMQFPGSYECYNLASSQCLTMIEAAAITKEIYERLFRKELAVNILGTEPVEPNQFSIDLKKIEAIGFTENKAFSLQSAITEIFTYLQSKQK